MTVIAWDGRTLAADKRMSCYGTAVTVCKLARVDDRLVGFSGSGKRAGALVKWLADGEDPEKYPAAASDDDACFMLVIQRDGHILRYENGPHPIVIGDRCAALGSGHESALVAMHLGCDARRAVEVVSLFDTNCGNGVDTLAFDEADATALPHRVVAVPCGSP